MKTLTIGVSGIDETKQRMKAAFRGKVQGHRYSFTTREDLLCTLSTPNQAMQHAAGLSTTKPKKFNFYL